MTHSSPKACYSSAIKESETIGIVWVLVNLPSHKVWFGCPDLSDISATDHSVVVLGIPLEFNPLKYVLPGVPKLV